MKASNTWKSGASAHVKIQNREGFQAPVFALCVDGGKKEIQSTLNKNHN